MSEKQFSFQVIYFKLFCIFCYEEIKILDFVPRDKICMQIHLNTHKQYIYIYARMLLGRY